MVWTITMSLSATNPERYAYLFPDRKHRLLACGLCRLIASLVDMPELIRIIETIEAFADGQVTASQLGSARHFALQIAERCVKFPLQEILASAVAKAADLSRPSTLNLHKTVDPFTVEFICKSLSKAHQLHAIDGVGFQQKPTFVNVLLDIEPHAITVCSAWRTSNVFQIAQQMYHDREFSKMQILADALQNNGCTNDEILNHCRGPSPHFRGCWVIDLILDKG